jgi:hypothetical protein
MLWEKEQRWGSILKLLQMVQIPVALVTRIRAGVLSGVPRTRSTDRHGAPSGVSIHEYGIAVRWTSISERRMDNTARAEFQVESEHKHEWKSEHCWRRKIHTSTMGRGVKDARICLEVDKHAGEP